MVVWRVLIAIGVFAVLLFRCAYLLQLREILYQHTWDVKFFLEEHVSQLDGICYSPADKVIIGKYKNLPCMALHLPHTLGPLLQFFLTV